MKLTAKTVAALKPRSEQYVVYCEDVPGFGAKVRPGGDVYFTVKYNFKGRQRRLSLGRMGDVTVEQARRKALAARGEVAERVDPQTGRDAERAMIKLDVAWERFVDMKSAKWSKNTRGGYEDRFTRLIRPELGNRSLGDITRADVLALHHKLRATPASANATIAVLSSFIGWARKAGLYPGDNPCSAVERFEETPRERVLSDDELARLGSALAAAGNDFPFAAIKLIVLTGCRKREVLDMKWAEVDLDAGTARLPETKTGARTIHLSPEAVELLRALPRLKGNPHVIPGENKGAPRYDLKKPWAAVTKAASLEGVSIHDLRRSFGSYAVSNGKNIYEVAKLLGHASVKQTERAYSFMRQDALAAAARDVSGGISNVLNSRVGNVLKLAGGGK